MFTVSEIELLDTIETADSSVWESFRDTAINEELEGEWWEKKILNSAVEYCGKKWPLPMYQVVDKEGKTSLKSLRWETETPKHKKGDWKFSAVVRDEVEPGKFIDRKVLPDRIHAYKSYIKAAIAKGFTSKSWFTTCSVEQLSAALRTGMEPDAAKAGTTKEEGAKRRRRTAYERAVAAAAELRGLKDSLNPAEYRAIKDQLEGF